MILGNDHVTKPLVAPFIEIDATICNYGFSKISQITDICLYQLKILGNFHIKSAVLYSISHLKKFELVEGDAKHTIPDYLKKHPETVVSMAILDFDIYEPTKVALECIKPHLMKGSILVFDELCDDIFPGETIAVQEILGLNNLRVKRMPMTSRVSYAVVE